MPNAWHIRIALVLLALAAVGCESQPRGLGIDRPAQPLRPAATPIVSQNGAYRDGDDRPTLMIAKHMPETVRVDAPFEYEITVRNTSDATLENVTIHEHLPPYLVLHGGESLNADHADSSTSDDTFIVQSPSPTGGFQDEMVFGIPRAESQLADSHGGRWEINQLQPGETRSLRLVAAARSPGQVPTRTTVNEQDEPLLTLAVEAIDPVIEVQRWSPPQVIACDTVPVYYLVTNVGTGTATGLVLEETLPEGQFYRDRQREVMLDVGSLEEGESAEFRIDTTLAGPGEYESFAIVTDRYGETYESNTINTIARAPELEVEIDVPESGYLGQQVPSVVRVTNVGDAVASDFEVRQVVPSDADVTQVSDTGYRRENEIFWPLGELYPGETAELSLLFSAQQPGELRTMVVANAYCADEQTAAATTRLEGVSSLQLELADRYDPMPLGELQSYRVRVTNDFNQADSNVQLTVTVPRAYRLIDTRSPGEPRFNAEQRQITFALGTLQPQQTVEVEVLAEPIRTGEARFDVELDSDNLSQPVITSEATRLY